MRTKKEIELLEQWDEQFPEFAPDKNGERVYAIRCDTCLKPLKDGTTCEHTEVLL